MRPRRLLLLLLALLPLAAGLYSLLRESPARHFVRFAVYRPTTAQFHFDRGAAPGQAIDYSHEATTTVPFGAAGDVGLVCPQRKRGEAFDLRVLRQGHWFLSGNANRPPRGDIVIGDPSDLPFCADFDGDGVADSGVFHDGAWLVATGRSATDADIRFSFGTAGDRPLVLNVAGAGNDTDRRNVVYGVYRAGMWYLDTDGSGAVGATHSFGGLPQDVPLLIPRWAATANGPRYSLAIFRDGTWFIKADPDGDRTLTFGFGQPGDLPSIDY
jgi:hypothetical protein